MAMPMIITATPVSRLIHSREDILNFFLKWLSIQVTRNQYVAAPRLTDIMIGVTFQRCGSCEFPIPKNAKSANITRIAPGFESPITRACRKSFTMAAEEDVSPAFILRKGFDVLMLQRLACLLGELFQNRFMGDRRHVHLQQVLARIAKLLNEIERVKD